MPDDFDVIGGTSLAPDSLAVKCCCCAKAVLEDITAKPLAAIARTDIATTKGNVPNVLLIFIRMVLLILVIYSLSRLYSSYTSIGITRSLKKMDFYEVNLRE